MISEALIFTLDALVKAWHFIDNVSRIAYTPIKLRSKCKLLKSKALLKLNNDITYKQTDITIHKLYNKCHPLRDIRGVMLVDTCTNNPVKKHEMIQGLTTMKDEVAFEKHFFNFHTTCRLFQHCASDYIRHDEDEKITAFFDRCQDNAAECFLEATTTFFNVMISHIKRAPHVEYQGEHQGEHQGDPHVCAVMFNLCVAWINTHGMVTNDMDRVHVIKQEIVHMCDKLCEIAKASKDEDVLYYVIQVPFNLMIANCFKNGCERDMYSTFVTYHVPDVATRIVDTSFIRKAQAFRLGTVLCDKTITHNVLIYLLSISSYVHEPAKTEFDSSPIILTTF